MEAVVAVRSQQSEEDTADRGPRIGVYDCQTRGRKGPAYEVSLLLLRASISIVVYMKEGEE